MIAISATGHWSMAMECTGEQSCAHTVHPASLTGREIWCLAIFTAIAPSSKLYIPQLPFRHPHISFFGQFFD
jgi:hypothetical protein